MTSGEWDLRALKALEEEEQKEFLALSQKSLFEPPSPPAGTSSTTKQSHSQQHQQKQLHQHSPHSSLSYAQLHPHLLKLPTINEYNLIAKRNQQNANSTGRLKFTRALSLSAHSLTGRGSGSGCGSGGASSKKSKRKFAASKSIGSLSPPQYSASPVYTPPPIRRCATLHYTQPVRKTFKTLQQLEKQKQEKKKEAALKNHKSPQLQRVAGTNKTFWKYGANSTAASIIGQRSLLKLKKQSADLESNTSDEVGSEEANTTERQESAHKLAVHPSLLNDYDDSATDTGSCTVPFATDSIEMMRLMLSAATTAVTTQPAAMAALDYLNPPPDIAAGATSGSELNDYSKFANNQFLTLSHYPTHIPPLESNETVAYEAFQTFSRRKSFSGRHGGATLMRGSSLIEEQHVDRDNSTAILTRNVNGRKMLKATSVDTPGVEYAGGIQPSTIITNPIVEGIKTSTAAKLSHMCHLTKTKAQTNLLPTAMVGLRFHDNPHNTNMHHHQQQHHVAAMLCQDITSNNSSSNSPPNAIDDELEQHIKHCSCSCNHMGYGNSMDYQTTGFGGLPDVTEHSNIRRTLSRQNSISNSDSGGEIASIQKSKVNFGDTKSSTSSGTASGKRNKSKAAQQNDNVEVQRYKSRRGSCVIGLTLMAAVCLLIVAATLAYQHFLMAPSRNSHAQRLKIVHRILREVPLVDGHNNFAWNVRKYAHSSLELVHLSQDLDHKSIWTRPSWAQTDIDRLKQGLVGVQVWSAYVPCEAQGLDAVQLALEQIDIVRRLADMYSQDTVLVTSSKDILAARRRGLMASLIGIEGGHAIGSSLGVLRSFYSLGARYLSLTHKCDVSWAGASVSPLENGLTQFGKAIIREMNRLGMMIDLSYSSDATARDVLQATRAPVIFSHSGARQLCNSTRNVPDDILRLVAENGGLIMISFDTEDVTCGRQSRLKDVIDHINYVRAIAGVQHIGIGAGYDGIEMPPIGLEDVSKYPDLLAALLEDHNWSEEDIAMLAGKNFLRIMETVENVRDYWKRAAIQPIEQTEPQPKTQCTYMSS